MEEALNRFFTDLLARPSGPLNLRFLLQPTVAVVLAVRAGMADAKLGREPYFRSVVANERERRKLLGEGWKDIGKLTAMACILDIAFQLIAMRWIYPLETLVVAALLAVIPYAIVRGIAARAAAILR